MQTRSRATGRCRSRWKKGEEGDRPPLCAQISWRSLQLLKVGCDGRQRVGYGRTSAYAPLIVVLRKVVLDLRERLGVAVAVDVARVDDCDEAVQLVHKDVFLLLSLEVARVVIVKRRERSGRCASAIQQAL